LTEKIFVLDTNVLIHSPQALFSFEENRVVVPIVVLEEIDQFKKGVDEKSVFDEATVKGFLPNTFGEFCPNQYLRITDNQDPARSRSLRYLKSSNAFHAMQFYTGEPVFGITARNFEQEMALDLLLDDSIKLVSLSGKAGTGKTLLAMAAGLQKVVEDQKYTRLVISRPISPLGKDLGYLPGTKSEKFNPWMQPIYDNMDILLSLHEDKSYENMKNKRKPSIEDFMDYGFLELEPLTYIRGRSLPDQFIIIDEAQNLTPHEMKTIITRAGENTKLVLTGDPYQIDIPYLDSASNGLSVAVEKLKNEDIVGHMTLEKGERSKLADLAAKYF
jgi:PhoH-like ATPase